jgi:hypothetical protein
LNECQPAQRRCRSRSRRARPNRGGADAHAADICEATYRDAELALTRGAYSRYGKTSSGSQRYGCKACKSTFSVAQLHPPRPAAPPARQDLYKVHGNKKSTPALPCSGCNERVPIKSNVGIAEELECLSAPLRRHQASQARILSHDVV